MYARSDSEFLDKEIMNSLKGAFGTIMYGDKITLDAGKQYIPMLVQLLLKSGHKNGETTARLGRNENSETLAHVSSKAAAFIWEDVALSSPFLKWQIAEAFP